MDVKALSGYLCRMLKHTASSIFLPLLRLLHNTLEKNRSCLEVIYWVAVKHIAVEQSCKMTFQARQQWETVFTFKSFSHLEKKKEKRWFGSYYKRKTSWKHCPLWNMKMITHIYPPELDGGECSVFTKASSSNGNRTLGRRLLLAFIKFKRSEEKKIKAK